MRRLHSDSLIPFAIALWALAAAGPGQGAGVPVTHPPVALPKDEPARVLPAKPAVAPLRVPIDCAAAPLITVTAGFDTTWSGDTSTAPDRVSDYPCAAWFLAGGEDLYRLHLPEAARLHVLLDPVPDLDVLLLSDCDSDACVAWANAEFAVELEAGDYLLVVDGLGQDPATAAAGAYELSLAAGAAGLDPAVAAAARPLACNVEGATALDNIFDRPDLLTAAAGCSDYLEKGGEVWFAVTLPDTAVFRAELSQIVFDGALWLFSGVGPDAVCVAAVDRGLAGVGEVLDYENDTGEAGVFYLGVDAFRPLTTEGGDFEGDGAFTLEILCDNVPVPAESRTLGRVKALFR